MPDTTLPILWIGCGILVAGGLAGGCDNLYFDPASVPLESAADGDGGDDGADVELLEDIGPSDAADSSGDTRADVPTPADVPTSADVESRRDTAASDVEPADAPRMDGQVGPDSTSDTGDTESTDTTQMNGAGQFACFRAAKCMSLHCPGFSGTCVNDYKSMVPSRRQTDIDEFSGCLASNQCDDYVGRSLCADNQCHQQMDRCVEDAPPTGTLTCAGYYRCAALCNPNSDVCFDRCEQRLGFLAKKQFEALRKCINLNCRPSGPDYAACIRDNCRSEYDTCMNCSRQ